MADGILAAVNENGNIDRFIDTKGGVHYIEPKRYEESVAKIDAAATKAKETVNSATEAVSECKAQTGACAQETARAKEIADTVESRITGIEGDIATLRDSVSQFKSSYVRSTVGSGYIEFCRVGGIVVMSMYNVTAKVSGSWGTTFIGTVPEGFRPNDQLRQRCQVANADSDRSSGLWVKPSGEMYIANFGGTGLSGSYLFSCTACWPAA